MDEPASALIRLRQPTWKGNYVGIEEGLYHHHCTHSMQQAARASDYTGFFYLGDLIEYDKTSNYFPKCQTTVNQ